MRVLGIDSSGMVASAAIVEDDVLLAEFTVNNKRTHSETLLPMVDEVVRSLGIELLSIDYIAAAAGPGSFTGLRIGAATVKGLGLALEVPVVPVKTCEALAYNFWGSAGVVCPIMDARRNQVYTGLYHVRGEIDVVMDQKPCDIAEIIDEINRLGEDVTFTGDGVDVYRDTIWERIEVPCMMAPAHMNRQRAAAVASLGIIYAKEGRVVSCDDFAPEYLRESQAERVKAEGKA